jgi:heme a synthase
MTRLAAILVALTFVLIFWGGQVTTTDSGDSVPPWPASFFIPKNTAQMWELGHRWIAGTTGVVAVILCVWILAREPRALPRRLAIAAVVLVVVQALIGGLRVKIVDKHVVAVVHALIAQAFLATCVALASSLRPWVSGPLASAGPPCFGTPPVDAPASAAQPIRWAAHRAFGLAVLTWIQTGFGAVLRHETRTHNKIGLVLHLAGAFLVIVFAVRLIVPIQERLKDGPWFRNAGRAVAAVLVLQLVLGLAAWTTTHTDSGYVNPTDVSSLIPTLHVVVGAALLALSVAIGMRAILRPTA